MSAALSSSAALSVAGDSLPVGHPPYPLEWSGNGTLSWLPGLSLLAPLAPFLPTVGYSVGWRSLPEYALRSLSTAAASVLGGEAALWAEAALCLALVLKRSLPSILVKNGCSYVG